MNQKRPDQQYGTARINAAGSFAFNTGLFSSILRTGVGIYELTLVDGASITECGVQTQILSAAATFLRVNVEWPSTTLMRLRVLQAV